MKRKIADGLGYIPESKRFGKYSLALKAPNCVAKPRRNPGFAYVLRLAGNFDSCATKIPNHFVSGINPNQGNFGHHPLALHTARFVENPTTNWCKCKFRLRLPSVIA